MSRRPARWNRLYGLATDCCGNVAVTFAISAVPIVLAVGVTIDYSRANSTKAALDAFADAASLSAVSRGAMSMTAAQAKSAAETFFRTQASNVKNATIGTVTATVTDGVSGRAVKLDYNAGIVTTISGIAGIKTLAVQGTATANSALPVYTDFYILLDNTPSMGVAATPADIARMVNATPDKCAFACHETDLAPNDYYGLARSLGVTMRIDVVRSATQQLMDTASTSQIVSNQYRAAVFSFGVKAELTGLTIVAPLSSNLSSVKTQAGSLSLMTVPYDNYAGGTGTNFQSIFTVVNSVIPAPGDGSTPSSPQKVLFFVSDGVQNAANVTCSKPTLVAADPKTGVAVTRCQSPIDPRYCAALKNRGVKIAVLYTTYLALPTNAWYLQWIDPFNKGPFGPSTNSEVANNMEACASPGLFFEVSPTQGIADAMNALFLKASQQARLSK